MTDDDELAQLEALLKLGTEPEPSSINATPDQSARADSLRRMELEARLRRQMELDQLTMQQAEARRERARWEAENYWWKGSK